MNQYTYTGNVRRICKACETPNRYPLAADLIGRDLLRTCGNCGIALNLVHARPIKGRVSNLKPCDASCLNAKGNDCECPCGGENHGRNWEVSAALAALATGKAQPPKARAAAPTGLDLEAVIHLEGYTGPETFLRSVAFNLHLYGHLTPAQRDGVIRRYDALCADATPAPVAPAPAPVTPPAPTANLSATVGFLAAARLRGVKWPRLTVPLAAFAPGADETVTLALAGEKAAEPGSVRVESATRRVPTSWGEGWAYYGKLHRDGAADLTRNAPAGLVDALEAIAADPIAAAARIARLTGYCTFCHSPISTDESLAVGYGDTCAANYGLPWGNRPSR